MGREGVATSVIWNSDQSKSVTLTYDDIQLMSRAGIPLYEKAVRDALVDNPAETLEKARISLEQSVQGIDRRLPPGVLEDLHKHSDPQTAEVSGPAVAVDSESYVPTVRVSFSNDMGTLTTKYHKVVVESGFILAILDDRSDSDRFIPAISDRASSELKEFELEISGSKYKITYFGDKAELPEHHLELFFFWRLS